MKYITPIAAVLLVLMTSFVTRPPKNPFPEFAPCAQPTPDKSILYLLEGDSMSKVIYNCWAKDPKWNGTSPKIVWVKKKKMEEIKKKYCSRPSAKK